MKEELQLEIQNNRTQITRLKGIIDDEDNKLK